MFFRSIRFKIFLWYGLVLSLTFFLFSIILYHTVNVRLNNDVNDLLLSKAEGIKDSIEFYWEAERLDLAEAGISREDLTKRHNLNFERIVQRWLQEKKDDALLLDIDVRILNAGGKLIASSARLPGLSSSVDDKSLLTDLAGGDRFEDLRVGKASGGFLAYRSLTSAQWEKQQIAYGVRVYSSLAPLAASLNHLKVMLFLLFPFTTILSGVIGAFLAGVTLRPINRVMDILHRITAENMRLRVEIPDTKDELKRLADTFNGMLDRLEEAFASQQRFIEDLAHELKTPLSVLKGELEVTLKKMRKAEDYESILRSSLEEINRVIRISENLLTLARYDNDRLALEKSPLDVGELVREILDEWGVLARQKNVALGMSADDGIRVAGDRPKLRHLFSNILDNALRHTPSGGRISVAVRWAQSLAEISVCDTGEGIPEAELPHIFDRFYRGETERSRPGFGLGLSIAKAIAEAHLGKIEATSILGQGTTFTVTLPAVAGHRPD
jgi:heavy metal sensor kinase